MRVHDSYHFSPTLHKLDMKPRQEYPKSDGFRVQVVCVGMLCLGCFRLRQQTASMEASILYTAFFTPYLR